MHFSFPCAFHVPSIPSSLIWLCLKISEDYFLRWGILLPRFPTKILYAFLLLHTCFMSRLFSPLWFDMSNNIWWDFLRWGIDTSNQSPKKLASYQIYHITVFESKISPVRLRQNKKNCFCNATDWLDCTRSLPNDGNQRPRPSRKRGLLNNLFERGARTRRFITTFTRAPTVPIVNQLKPVPHPPANLPKSHSDNILPSRLSY
jgi:hypothetical protein